MGRCGPAVRLQQKLGRTVRRTAEPHKVRGHCQLRDDAVKIASTEHGEDTLKYVCREKRSPEHCAEGVLAEFRLNSCGMCARAGSSELSTWRRGGLSEDSLSAESDIPILLEDYRGL